jgi:glycosyltransferase involved in cell wall biosynthesis
MEVPEISVVVLCYKAGTRVPQFVQRIYKSLEERGLSYELVLVGNYNAADALTDSTPQVVRNLAAQDPRIKAITEEKRGMFGWDVKKGLSQTRGKHIAFIDGDGQMPAIDVVRVYDALKLARADMAQTYRAKRHDGAQRIFISRVYNILLRALFPEVSIYDANSKPKIFTREALEKLVLLSDNWFIDAEIVIQAGTRSFKIAQIPTVFHKQSGRPSFVNAGAVMRFLADLLRYRFKRDAPWRQPQISGARSESKV